MQAAWELFLMAVSVDIAVRFSFAVFVRPTSSFGRAIAWAVSPRLLTATAWVRARIRSCGICGTGAGFVRVLLFPLQIRIPPIAPQSPSSIIWGWYNRPKSGRSTKWTQSHPMKKKKLPHSCDLASSLLPLSLTVQFTTYRRNHIPAASSRLSSVFP
jgi:hypothetical protein